MLYNSLIRPLLFQLDAERAHTFALYMAERLSRVTMLCQWTHKFARPESRPVELFGCTFPNPIGLAAGMDKNGVAPFAWWAFGFGFVELGTVTPRPQSGNLKPRMFRLPKDQAIVNRMGFNNCGAKALADRLTVQCQRGQRPPIPIGISVGKNKDTPAERAITDFVEAASIVAPQADFLTVNVSSPNTPGLRALQNADDVHELVKAVRVATHKPVLIKFAPELSGKTLWEVLDAASEAGVSGVIATNTLSTMNDDTLPQGGLSGPPLYEVARERVIEIREHISDDMPIIGCGGIRDVATAQAMIDAGANLIQLYTALVYEGPFLPARLCQRIDHKPKRNTPTLPFE